MTQWSELRLHDGGPCPVRGDEVVRVILRKFYATAESGIRAKGWKWEHSGGGADIIAYQVALPEPRDMQVPWHVLPDGYRWAARDEDGEACAFAAKPEKLGSMWRVGEVGSDYIRIDQLVGYDPGTKPWDQSLIQRTEGV